MSASSPHDNGSGTIAQRFAALAASSSKQTDLNLPRRPSDHFEADRCAPPESARAEPRDFVVGREVGGPECERNEVPCPRWIRGSSSKGSISTGAGSVSKSFFTRSPPNSETCAGDRRQRFCERRRELRKDEERSMRGL